MSDYCSTCRQWIVTRGGGSGPVVAHVSKGAPCLDTSRTSTYCYTTEFVKEDAEMYNGGDIAAWQAQNLLELGL